MRQCDKIWVPMTVAGHEVAVKEGGVIVCTIDELRDIWKAAVDYTHWGPFSETQGDRPDLDEYLKSQGVNV